MASSLEGATEGVGKMSVSGKKKGGAAESTFPLEVSAVSLSC